MTQGLPKPGGRIVWSLRNDDNGDLFEVERLVEPILRGSGWRTHRLWRNGRPEIGCQWQYDLESAKWWAAHRMESDLYQRISQLTTRVHKLDSELAQARFNPQPF